MRRIALLGGSTIVLLGVLLMFDALGFIQVSVWGIMWSLLLIAVGVWLVWGVFARPRPIEAEKVAIPLEGAERARVRIRHGAGRLHMKAGAGPDELVAGTFGGGLDYQARRDGDALNVEMRVPSPSFGSLGFPWVWGSGRGLDWSLGLNSEIPLALHIEGGASDNRLDLTDLRVTDLRMQTGASATNLTLPASAGHTKVDINSGVGSVRIRVPSGVAARIRVGGALAGTTVYRRRFPRVGSKMYESPDYDTAPNKVDVDIETSVGSLDIR